MKHLVFVYGTLLTNERNHYLIENAKLIDKGYIENFYMFNLGRYPGIQKGAGKVLGEVYEVDDETLAKLDVLEDEGTMYKKIIVVTTLDNKQTVAAYVYEYILNQHQNELDLEVYDWKKIK